MGAWHTKIKSLMLIVVGSGGHNAQLILLRQTTTFST